MQTIPKIVRERLKAAPVPADHPDPDVLTAFAELSLPPSERATVLVHLSRCVDCRDIVALALPPTEAAQPVITPARGGWLTWPALRWGFVAVGVVAIASVGILQYQHRYGSSSSVAISKTVPPVATYEAKNQIQPPAAATIPAPKPEKVPTAPAAGDKLVNKRVETEPSADKQLDEGKQTSASPQNGLTVGGPAAGTKVFHGGPYAAQQQSAQQQQQTPSLRGANPFTTGGIAAGAAGRPISPSTQSVRVTPTPSAPPAQSAATETTLAQNQPAAGGVQDESVVRSKKADTTTVEVASAAPAVEPAENVDRDHEMPKVTGEPVVGRNITAKVALTPISPPRWNISSTGNLQRSYDQGGTWQDVNVIAGLVPASSFARYDSNAVMIIPSEKSSTKKDKKANKRDQSVPGPQFRTVTASGSEIWAGGSSASLFHSTDGGDHWVQVLPSSGGAALTGDVVALEFLDPQHGKVTTSTPEVWTTSDAGQSWQKQ